MSTATEPQTNDEPQATNGASGNDEPTTQREKDRERVQSLMDGGMQRSDALKKVAEERGVSLSTIRAAASNTTRTGTRTTVRRKPQTPEEMIQEAKAMLQSALDGLEKEVEQAKERADEAAAEYKSLKESMTERKKSLKQKIAALDA